MKNRTRYAFPGRIYDLLLSDDKFLNDVSKLRKVDNSFPKYDHWKDDAGFHITYALAGYTPDDISIFVRGRQIFIESGGIEISESEIQNEVETGNGAEEVDVKNAKIAINKGMIIRGIARRSFKTNLFVSEDFDLSKIKASMEHGLLSIFAPNVSIDEIKVDINK